MDRHRKYDKMYTVYSQETKMSPFEIKSKIPPKDQRIHMVLYFIPPDEEIEKFDVYWMLKLKQYAHVLPIIGKVDGMSVSQIISLKCELTKMAHLNNLAFFDVYESLILKLKNYPEKTLHYFIEDEAGPCPPFSLITFWDTIIEKDKNEVMKLQYGRKLKSWVWNSLEDGTSDLTRLYKILWITCSHVVKNTNLITTMLKEQQADEFYEKKVNPTCWFYRIIIATSLRHLPTTESRLSVWRRSEL